MYISTVAVGCVGRNARASQRTVLFIERHPIAERGLVDGALDLDQLVAGRDAASTERLLQQRDGRLLLRTHTHAHMHTPDTIRIHQPVDGTRAEYRVSVYLVLVVLVVVVHLNRWSVHRWTVVRWTENRGAVDRRAVDRRAAIAHHIGSCILHCRLRLLLLLLLLGELLVGVARAVLLEFDLLLHAHTREARVLNETLRLRLPQVQMVTEQPNRSRWGIGCLGL